MKLSIDMEERKLTLASPAGERSMDLYSREAFELLAEIWLKVGWDQKYSYAFTWMGRPIIQLPEDMVRVQEVIYRVRPDVIVETGVAHGGSLVFYASLCKAMDHGRVVGIDVCIRPKNRAAIESHELFPWITLIEGDSVSPAVVDQLRNSLKPTDKVLVILDSCHTKEHVLKELEAYHPVVTEGSYIVATDGIMRILHDVPGGKPHWNEDNPASAAREFAQRHPEFVLERPPRAFDESRLPNNITYWPDAFLRRVK